MAMFQMEMEMEISMIQVGVSPAADTGSGKVPSPAWLGLTEWHLQGCPLWKVLHEAMQEINMKMLALISARPDRILQARARPMTRALDECSLVHHMMVCPTLLLRGILLMTTLASTMH